MNNVIKIDLSAVLRGKVELVAAARLRYIASTKWDTRRYMDMDRLKELRREQQAAKEEVA